MLQDPDVSRLTQEFLLKNTSTKTADSVTAMVSQTAQAIIDTEEKYRVVGIRAVIHQSFWFREHLTIHNVCTFCAGTVMCHGNFKAAFRKEEKLLFMDIAEIWWFCHVQKSKFIAQCRLSSSVTVDQF